MLNCMQRIHAHEPTLCKARCIISRVGSQRSASRRWLVQQADYAWCWLTEVLEVLTDLHSVSELTGYHSSRGPSLQHLLPGAAHAFPQQLPWHGNGYPSTLWQHLSLGALHPLPQHVSPGPHWNWSPFRFVQLRDDGVSLVDVVTRLLD